MAEIEIGDHTELTKRAATMRDYVGILFRHRQLVIVSFLALFLTALVLSVVIVANSYEANMKVLVKHERADPMVTPESSQQLQIANDVVTEEEVNTEVNLLQSEDILQKVVTALGLQNKKRLLDYLLPFRPLNPEERIAKATRSLKSDLGIETLTKTNLIDVTYKSSDPKLAAEILNTLAQYYLEKHLEVHRPPGALDFFQKQTAHYQQALADAEARLASYDRNKKAVSAPLERDTAVQNYAALASSLAQTRISMRETERRIHNLEAQLASTPARVDTQLKSTDSYQLLEQDKANLLSLELKRTELLTRFDVGYPLVKEVESEIAQTRTAITEAEKNPFFDRTTDQNPTHGLLEGELAKAREDLATYEGRETATIVALRDFQEEKLRLDQKALDQQDLLRTAKADEDNYLLYLHKQEEARISDAMDSRRMVNVAIAQPALEPVLPAKSPLMFALLGALVAAMSSVGLAFASEYLSPSFHKPEEVMEFLNVAVLASIPKSGQWPQKIA
jgi:uncharacterized protein involved in exopolysaccharide biosynthesis